MEGSEGPMSTQQDGRRLTVVFVGSASVGPRFIMGMLKKSGHRCFGIYQGIDARVGDDASVFFPPISMAELLAMKPDVVGFSACSFDIGALLSMAAAVKKASPSTLVAFGGVHPTIEPEATMAHPYVDLVCIGEGEHAMAEFCDALAAGGDTTRIPSLWVRCNGVVHRNPVRDWCSDLDSLPLDREGFSYLGIYTGRGCAGRCAFCNTPVMKKMVPGGRFFRKRSIPNVLDEIAWMVEHDAVYVAARQSRPKPSRLARGKRLVKRVLGMPAPSPYAGLPTVRFKDDSFLIDKRWFMSFAESYRQRFVGLSYMCQARANEIDEEVALALGESGCDMVSLGIECGNEQFRNDVLNKRITNEQVFTAVRLLKQHGMKVLGQWILGYPGETAAQALESLRLHTRLGDIPQVHIAVPFPHTEMHAMAVRMGLIPANYMPDRGIYDDFMFHRGAEKMLLRVVYNLFPVAGLRIPDDLEALSFLGSSHVYKGGKTVGEVLGMNLAAETGGVPTSCDVEGAGSTDGRANK
jgi:hypothetical protein